MAPNQRNKKKVGYRVFASLIILFFVVSIVSVLLFGIGLIVCGKE
jgi:hypothetical protein